MKSMIESVNVNDRPQQVSSNGQRRMKALMRSFLLQPLSSATVAIAKSCAPILAISKSDVFDILEESHNANR